MTASDTSDGSDQQQFDSLASIIDQVIQTAQADKVTVREIFNEIGTASFAPVLLIPAIAVATPLSGIPLFSALMGVMIALISVQMLFRRKHLWLPDWILRRKVSGDKVVNAFNRIKPVTNWLDNHTGKRLRLFVKRPLIFVPQLICVLSGLAMPMLELVPFSSSVIGAGVTLLALGMLTRDGLLLMIAMIPYGIVVWLVTSGIA